MQSDDEKHINELRRTLKQIEILIEDNNRNIKDCISIVKDINNTLKKKTKRKSIFNLLNIKSNF